MQHLLHHRPPELLARVQICLSMETDANRRAATPVNLEQLKEQNPVEAGGRAVIRALII